MSRVTRHEMIAIRALQLSETTHRFCYRPVARADAHPMFEAGLDSDFHRYLDWSKPADVDGAMVRLDGLLSEELLNTSVTSSIVDKPTGQWMGMLRWSSGFGPSFGCMAAQGKYWPMHWGSCTE